MTAIRLDKLLKSGVSNRLENIVQNAQIIQGLTAALQAALDTDGAAELLAANLHDDGTLVIVASSSAWAAKLRFEEQALLDAARAHGTRPSSLKVVVARNG